jgi:hypothetical protein
MNRLYKRKTVSGVNLLWHHVSLICELLYSGVMTASAFGILRRKSSPVAMC